MVEPLVIDGEGAGNGFVKNAKRDVIELVQMSFFFF